MIKEEAGHLFLTDKARVKCYQVSCTGEMDHGVAADAKNKYPEMYAEYQERCRQFGEKTLGDVQFYVSGDGNVLANMFAQGAYPSGKSYIDYFRLLECLRKVREFADRYGLSVALPRSLGCGHAGGEWDKVYPLIEQVFGVPGAPDCYVMHFVPESEDKYGDLRRTPAPASTERPIIQIYTDGACSGNPGPGGWGAILVHEEKELAFSGGSRSTTNNRMEITAVIEAVKRLKRPCRIELFSDSQYVCKAFTEKWIDKWKQNGWKRTPREPVKNADLWQELLTLLEPHTMVVHWIRGHNGHPYNERCDAMAVEEANRKKDD